MAEKRVCIGNSTDPHLNLAVEEYLVGEGKDFGDTLFLWRNERTVVIGRNQNPWRECAVEKLLGDGGTLARRRTGGGAVYHDKNNLNFSFVRSPSKDNTAENFRVITSALRTFGIDAEVSGRNDMTVSGAKFSGSAFFKTKEAELHHGTLLVDTDVAAMTAYLGVENAPEGDKRSVASVKSRVINLKEVAPGLTAEQLSVAVQAAFCGEECVKPLDFDLLASNPEVLALRDRNKSVEWLFGDWQNAVPHRSVKLGWGRLEYYLQNGKFVLASDGLFPAAVLAAQDELNGEPRGTALTDDEDAVRAEIVRLCRGNAG